ncbi:DUF2194 domain-containing protein [Roseburia hominis]|uniref:DUF2194 domain-containing protein n=1 Tax=Roseburia hominis TaxID=301301 RepID=A0A395VEB2_9FIRM|nr:DUF2194 domain-containing protein [Roseburia hominis]RGS41832.1 DUF2194 domain-containing protein [Roseburia hominis]
MVSRRNYLTIAMMFVILLFMFQFTGVMKEQLSEYESNEYADDTTTSFQRSDAFLAEQTSADACEVIYVGEAGGAEESVVKTWCSYRKRTFFCSSSLALLDSLQDDALQVLVVDGSKVTSEEEVAVLRREAQMGVTVIFATLPQSSVIREYRDLRELLGIRAVIADEIPLAGMHLFSGFLLGGEEIYEVTEPGEEERQDMNPSVPWYTTGAGTKTYMVGTLSEETIEQTVDNEIRAQYAGMEEEAAKNSLLPAILWRNSVDTAKIFCVNGDYLADISAVGILDAMMGETYDYDIYPVINAQNLVIADLPAFVFENEEEMQKRYSQSAQAVYQEIVWPSLTSIASRTGAKMTCMMTPQFTYTDEEEPDGENVTYYLKRLKEEHAEAGLSADSREGIPLSEKIKQDQTFWQTYAPSYRFLSLYADGVKSIGEESALPAEIRTVALGSGASEAVGYLNENVTLQPSTSSGIRHTFLDDFKVKCMETALGYSNITLDLYSVTYPEGDEDSWEKMSKKIAANLGTYWKAYEAFDATTLTESDVRIRRFLALDYKQQRTGNVIILSLEHREDAAWFLLRLHGEEVTEVAGGSFEEVEDGVYLILAEEDEVSVEVQTGETWQYQDGGKRGDGT